MTKKKLIYSLSRRDFIYGLFAGVVDKNLKVFGVNDVYVCGSSVFPTVGYSNPTLTIVALALRLAEHLHE